MDPAWVSAAVALFALIAGGSAWALRWMWRLGRKTWAFIDDWEGSPAVPGHPAQPGVLERLVRLEEGVAGISAQVHLDSGHSMKDVVIRTEAAVSDLQRSVDKLNRRVP